MFSRKVDDDNVKSFFNCWVVEYKIGAIVPRKVLYAVYCYYCYWGHGDPLPEKDFFKRVGRKKKITLDSLNVYNISFEFYFFQEIATKKHNLTLKDDYIYHNAVVKYYKKICGEYYKKICGGGKIENIKSAKVEGN